MTEISSVVVPLYRWCGGSDVQGTETVFPVHGNDRNRRMRGSTEERRQEKLDLMAHQIKNGTLVIRTMGPEERELYPPRPVKGRFKSSPRRRVS
jgi:hypothetical protein